MWKGGNDWALEFPDRIQWMLFNEMHEEYYKCNICAASLKYIPISSKIDNDIDMAMNPVQILYDMDSEDEQWILRIHISLQTQETSCRVITDDLFVKTMIC
ncbi:hypothetical protein POM88_036308 [Heracleum sosnowskyi]|uniref:Uncharacterized protein n=1 Tax=Heracleum sosnowskyi TaxID=360622 RepID=A0AAD8ME58_9APIA|nr:hypothetical protein POM88_036308 [Heracleum sosnowskyi]